MRLMPSTPEDVPVAMRSQCTGPKPTAIGNFDLCPKPLGEACGETLFNHPLRSNVVRHIKSLFFGVSRSVSAVTGRSIFILNKLKLENNIKLREYPVATRNKAC